MPGGINMVQCRITFTHEKTWNFFTGTEEKRDLKEGPCWQTPISTAINPGAPAPMSPVTPPAPTPDSGRR